MQSNGPQQTITLLDKGSLPPHNEAKIHAICQDKIVTQPEDSRIFASKQGFG